MKKASAIFLLFCFLFTSWASAAEEKEKSSRALPFQNIFDRDSTKVEVVADSLEYVKGEKKIIAKGNVVITYQNFKITSDYGEVQTETKEAYARGHVIIFKNDVASASGEEIYYDFATGKGNFPNGRSINTPWYATGEDIEQLKQGVRLVRKGGVTTCNLETPHYEIRAKKATVYQGDKIVAQNVTIYVLGKPVLWLPFLIIPLQEGSVPFGASAGYKSEFGAYIQLFKGFSITKNISGKFLVDWYSKRGVGLGGTLNYDFGKYAVGDFIGYWINDERAPTPNTPNPFSQTEQRERGRITWRHRTDLDRYSNIMFRYNYLSDQYFLQDYFEKEFRAEIQPQSFVTITKNSENYGFYAYVQKRINSFESQIQKLPEVRFDWKTAPLFEPWLFYESETSFANLDAVFGYSNMTHQVIRFDNFHEWSIPVQWNDIKFTPYANIRNTLYSREFTTDTPRWRVALGFGADLRTQFYKTFDVQFDKLGVEVNNLRHILEPVVRYDGIHPSTVSSYEIYQFDSIDQIAKSDKVTFGLENRLQTKRMVEGKMRTVDIVSLNTYLSYQAHEQHPYTPKNFTEFEGEFILRPYNWLQYRLRMNYDLKDNRVSVLEQDFIAQNKKFRLLLGYSLVDNPSYIPSFSSFTGRSNQFLAEGRYIINHLWAIGGYIRYDAVGNDLQEWQVSATRDLHDFILDFGYNVRIDQIAGNDKQLFFNFRMKAFPEYKLAAGGGRATFSDPRIGETVSGANVFQSPAQQAYQDGYPLTY